MDQTWREEQERVDDVERVIEEQLEQAGGRADALKKDVVELRRNFWDDVTVNLDELDDVVETFASMKQQAELLAERERTHGQSYRKIRKLKRLRDSPYFGRIDFREEGENEAERIYIGTGSLLHGEEFIVYDWRAPISSLYYDYAPGPAEYTTPAGIIDGTMELKRQFVIKNGRIEGLFDTGITIGDSLLQEVLSGHSDSAMKSIVATIQREQNEVIRNDSARILVVQGAAGSGKTSAALQRAAYLLYRHRDRLSADQVLLFSPNPLFNSYVATVLPELGEENMKQTTYQEYIQSRLWRQFEVEDPYAQMEYTLTRMADPEYETRMEAIRWKGGMEFKELLDRYADSLGSEGLIFKNIRFRGTVIISAADISKIFYGTDPGLVIPNRLQMTAEALLAKLASIERKERGEDWVLAEAELLDKEDYLDAFRSVQRENADHDETFDDYERERAFLEKVVVDKYFNPIRQAVKQLRFLNMKKQYAEFFRRREVRGEHGSREALCDFTRKQVSKGVILYEDATPFLYLQDLIEGRKFNTQIRYLFIDEAQDYSPFQFAFIRQLFPHAKLTILGDINQAITPNAASGSLPGTGEEGAEIITLLKSYRSTKQIVEFTKPILPGGERIIPFNRNGAKPVVAIMSNENELITGAAACAEAMLERGNETAAIICKSEKEAKEVYECLRGSLDVHLLNQSMLSFEKGILIVPSYIAKGIEFDGVVIYNASEAVYSRENERKLFYTACTRAMHELYVFSLGKLSPFMDEIPETAFEREGM